MKIFFKTRVHILVFICLIGMQPAGVYAVDMSSWGMPTTWGVPTAMPEWMKNLPSRIQELGRRDVMYGVGALVGAVVVGSYLIQAINKRLAIKNFKSYKETYELPYSNLPNVENERLGAAGGPLLFKGDNSLGIIAKILPAVDKEPKISGLRGLLAMAEEVVDQVVLDRANPNKDYSSYDNLPMRRDNQEVALTPVDWQLPKGFTKIDFWLTIANKYCNKDLTSMYREELQLEPCQFLTLWQKNSTKFGRDAALQEAKNIVCNPQ